MTDRPIRPPNRSFTQTNLVFREACEAVGLPPTTRQASKWQACRGLAWTFRHRHKEIDRLVASGYTRPAAVRLLIQKDQLQKGGPA